MLVAEEGRRQLDRSRTDGRMGQEDGREKQKREEEGD